MVNLFNNYKSIIYSLFCLLQSDSVLLNRRKNGILDGILTFASQRLDYGDID